MAIFQHRAFHALTTSYVYWNSTTEYDVTGIDYVGPPPFGELTNIVVLREIPEDVPDVVQIIPDETTDQDHITFPRVD